MEAQTASKHSRGSVRWAPMPVGIAFAGFLVARGGGTGAKRLAPLLLEVAEFHAEARAPLAH
jgi:hypothetical protein